MSCGRRQESEGNLRPSGGHSAWALVILPALLQFISTSVSAGVNTWTSLGPDGGGVFILAVDPQHPDTVYAATAAGFAVSTDGAETWKAISPLPPGSGAVLSLVADPQNSGTLYAAGFPGESGDDAVFKTTDGGTTWQRLRSGSALRLSAPLAVDPRNSNVIYSGGYDPAVKGTAILKSNDGGETWRVSSQVVPAFCCFLPTFVAIDPNNSANVYAGLVSGVYKSTDAGAGWRPLYTYTGADKPQMRDVAINGRNSNILYGFDINKGIFESTDGGANWRAVNSGLPASTGQTAYYGVNSFAMDAQDSNTLYAGTFEGIFKSTDGGANWRPSNLGVAPQAPGALAVDPLHSGTLYAGVPSSRGGLYKSTDGGATWTLRFTGFRAMPVNQVAIDTQHPATIYVTTSLSRQKSTDGGTSWQVLPPSGIGPMVLDPGDTNTVYAGAGLGVGVNDADTLFGDRSLRLAKSLDAGASWNPASTGLPRSCASLVSLSIDPQDTATLYAAFNSEDFFCQSSHTGGLWRTSDGGANWTKLAPPDSGGGGAHGVAIDPLNSATLYGWNGMGIFKSTDRGATWELNSALPKCTPELQGCSLGNVLAVVIDPQTSSTLYAVLRGEGILKSTDSGASWFFVNSGLPTALISGSLNYLTTSLVIDPVHPDTLYTNGNGVYRSTDGGATWNGVNTGLTTFVVNIVAIDPLDTRTVYAGTAGGLFAITFHD